MAPASKFFWVACNSKWPDRKTLEDGKYQFKICDGCLSFGKQIFNKNYINVESRTKFTFEEL